MLPFQTRVIISTEGGLVGQSKHRTRVKSGVRLLAALFACIGRERWVALLQSPEYMGTIRSIPPPKCTVRRATRQTLAWEGR